MNNKNQNDDQITFCIVFTNQAYARLVLDCLLNFGIFAYNINHPKKALSIIAEKKTDFLFLDFDYADQESFNLMNELKNNGNLSNMFVLATSSGTNHSFIKKLEEYNVISFIPKPITKQLVMDKIKLILTKFENQYKRRKHIRVKPDDNELMRLSFRLKNKKYICAKVLDVSMGGIAVLMYSPYESEELLQGHLIEHLIFEANHREIDIDAKVISKKEKFIAFKFTHFYEQSYADLSRYIMKKLSL